MRAEYWLAYLGIISLIAVIACISDKHRAKKKKSRISEKTLFIISFLGGSAAMYITMKAIRHKTLHKRFMIGIPLILLLQIAAICYLQFYLDINLIQ